MNVLLKLFLLYYVFLNVQDILASHRNYVSEESPEKEENPSDIASVSKFIKEFHRKIEDDFYPINDVPESPSDFDYLAPYIHENGTVNGTSPDKNGTSFINCNTDRKSGSLSVELVNSTRLMSLLTSNPNITNRHIEAECVVLLFYARTCPFSCLAAPHFNALPRAFPSVKMAAVNAMLYQSFNTQFGIAGVPTIILFHNGRAVAKFNDSEYTLKMFARFIAKFTGLKPAEKMFVTSADFGGPVPSRLTKERDLWLVLAWAVILLAAAVGVSKSQAWRALVETVQNTWREAQAQHEHTE